MISGGRACRCRRGVLLIYLTLYLFFVGKMLFYAAFVGYFPDEMEHVSYVAYLESSGRLLPDFSRMFILVRAGEDGGALNSSNDFSGTLHFSSRVNYLGHPPLYYQLLRLTGGVKVSGGDVTVDIARLRGASMALAAVAMLLILYIGWSRIHGGPAAHMLYGTLCVSVPMLAYGCAGVNNDTLAMLGVPIFLLGLLRWAEGRRGWRTTLLVAAGVNVALLAKLTAGMMVCLTLLIAVLIFAVRRRSIRELLTLPCLGTLPIYLLTGAYFLWVYRQTGSVQPTLRRLSPDQFYSSTFYVPVSQRQSKTFWQFVLYYRYAMTKSWVGIFSHVRYLKTGPAWDINQIALNGMWVLPAAGLIGWWLRRPDNRGKTVVLGAAYAAILLTAGTQCVRSYMEFTRISGYLGGTSSRYYLCAVPVLALSMALPAGDAMAHARRGRAWQWAAMLYCGLLLYEDFGYFLLYYGGAVLW